MGPDTRPTLDNLRLFLTVDHPCGYLPERMARNLVADPEVVDQATYNKLAHLGFRRSGEHIYRPHCPGCDACQSLRVPVREFQPNRNQRRNWQRNSDLRVEIRDPGFRREHFELFQHYLKSRHPDGGMDNATPDSYLDFITAQWSDTLLMEFRDGARLLAVAVVDRLADGLSAVYTFFDPGAYRRSLGTYAIIQQITEARRLGLTWVYLGYWIAECDKMRYKATFRPYEVFRNGRWCRPPGQNDVGSGTGR